MHYYDSAPCAHVKDGKRCVNLLVSHDKGHQDSSGEIFGQGNYTASYNSSTRQAFWSTISTSYAKTAKELWHLKNSTSDYAREVISRHKTVLVIEQSFWKSATSHVTCFFCLVCHPHNVLPCGHTICESCIKNFGVQNGKDAFVFQLAKCALCRQSLSFQYRPLDIQLKPEDSGVRILCLDGGGTRGVISCKILELLEKEIGLGLPIDELFHCIVSIRTGGIIALWTGKKSLARANLSRKLQGPHQACLQTTCWRLFTFRWVALAYCKGSFYQTTEIEMQLQQAFQSKKRLLFGDDFTGPFSDGKERCRALKIAIPAKTAIYLEACLIINYDCKRNIDDIKIYREDNPRNGMEVWEAARCALAIPTIFQAYEAKNGQRFRDGGVEHCNPVKIAIEEAMLLWPKSSQLDYVVTIGTGYTDQPIKPAAPPEGLSGFLLRSWTNFKDYFDNEIMWQKYKRSIDPAQLSRYHRFNLQLPRNALPDLDNISKISDLEIATGEAFSPIKPLRAELRKTAATLIAALFYLRIDSISTLGEGYYVHVTIVCRLEKKHHKKVVAMLLTRNAHFHANGKKLEIPDDLLRFVMRGSYYLWVPEKFAVESLAQMVEIYLVLDSHTHRSSGVTKCQISGSPLSLERHHNLVSDSTSRLSRRSSLTSLSGAYTPSATETATSYEY